MKKEIVSRGQFLKELGLSSGALLAFYCLGTTMTACSKDDSTTPSGTDNSGVTGTTTGANIDFVIDLANTSFAKLKTEGGFAYVENIIIANAKGGKFVALAKKCTHAGTVVQYRLSENDFYCDNHHSEFSTTGAVEKSPATQALTSYKTESQSNGTKLRIYA
jgi:cytochrome b6-f complex iron-sulfur subunit